MNNTIQELMNRPYALIQTEKKLMLLELGVSANLEQGMEKALQELKSKKEAYFQEMILQGGQHLIPEPYFLRNKVIPLDTYALKRTIARASIFALFIIIGFSVSAIILNSVLKKNMLRLEGIIKPVGYSNEEKLDKYRHCTAELIKFMEEGKKKKP